MTDGTSQKLELVFSAELPRREDLKRLCDRAVRERVRSIAVPSGAIVLAQHFLGESDVKISCRIGLPQGEIDSDVKRYETEFAVDAGAHELELVPSLGRIADGEYNAILREIRDVVEGADERPVKVAIQPERWTEEVLREVVQIVLDSGAQYVRAGGENSVRVVRQLCGPTFGIIGKATNMAEAGRVIAAGANFVAKETLEP